MFVNKGEWVGQWVGFMAHQQSVGLVASKETFERVYYSGYKRLNYETNVGMNDMNVNRWFILRHASFHALSPL